MELNDSDRIPQANSFRTREVYYECEGTDGRQKSLHGLPKPPTRRYWSCRLSHVTQTQGYLSLTYNSSFARQQATLPKVSLLHQTDSRGLYFLPHTFHYVTETVKTCMTVIPRFSRSVSTSFCAFSRA